MKFTFVIPCFFILFFNSAFAQTYENPYVESVGADICYITKVEFTKQYTIVSFEHLNNNNGWIRLSPDIKIKTPENLSYAYVKSEGISIAPEMYYFKGDEGKHAFKVYFKPLPKNTKIFDIIEVEPGSRFDFNFYGVNIGKNRISEKQTSHFPKNTEVVLASPPPAPFSGNFMFNAFKDIYKTSIEASVNYFKQPDVMKEQAHMRKAFYDALVVEGFTKEQAMQILIATSFR